MTYAHIYPYRILADEAFANFIMTEERYNRWKYGRTYDMDGIIYHSGEPQMKGAE